MLGTLRKADALKHKLRRIAMLKRRILRQLIPGQSDAVDCLAKRSVNRLVRNIRCSVN